MTLLSVLLHVSRDAFLFANVALNFLAIAGTQVRVLVWPMELSLNQELKVELLPEEITVLHRVSALLTVGAS